MKVSKRMQEFKNTIFGIKDLETLAKKGAQNVQATLDKVEGEEAYAKATETAIEVIKEHPELAIELLNIINEDVSSRVAVNAVIQLLEEDDFSEKTTIKATEKLSLEDDYIVTIIKKSDLSYKDSMEIAQQLTDSAIRKEIQQELKEKEEQRSLSKLKPIYMMCDENMNESTLEELLDKVMENIQVNTVNIRELRSRIIAKKIAFNYATYGTNIVSKQRTLMTAKQMYETNIVQMAKEEYEKIEKEYETIKGEKIKKFNEQELEYKILKEIEATEVNTKFNEEETLKEIVSMMKATLAEDERKELLIRLKEEVVDEKIRRTYQDIRELGIVEMLAGLSENKRKKVLETFKGVIGKRLSVAERTPKMKLYKFNDKEVR